jgi:putative tryptophan/tyrosine transport system substrate-binding protein
MRRREFIAGLGSAAAWPLAARTQQSGKLPTIGFLGSATASTETEWVAAFAQRLRELGWIDGGNVAIEYRWSEGRNERYAEIAAEFARLKVEVIVTQGTAPSLAAMHATSEIPIVFAGSGDPVATGLVASLARPGGNVTGLSNQQLDATGKRVQLLRDVVPGLRRLAILGNTGNPAIVREMSEAQAAARMLGLDVAEFEIRGAEDIAPAFEAFKGRVDALYVAGDPLTTSNRVRIITLALAARLPTISENVETGGLMSYGANNTDQYRRAAAYVDKVLRGAKPADLPVEQPTRFKLIINLKTAKALGLTIPETLLATADEVIQ